MKRWWKILVAGVVTGAVAGVILGMLCLWLYFPVWVVEVLPMCSEWGYWPDAIRVGAVYGGGFGLLAALAVGLFAPGDGGWRWALGMAAGIGGGFTAGYLAGRAVDTLPVGLHDMFFAVPRNPELQRPFIGIGLSMLGAVWFGVAATYVAIGWRQRRNSALAPECSYPQFLICDTLGGFIGWHWLYLGYAWVALLQWLVFGLGFLHPVFWAPLGISLFAALWVRQDGWRRPVLHVSGAWGVKILCAGIVLFVLLLPVMSLARYGQERIRCRRSLERAWEAIENYRTKHGGAYPPDLELPDLAEAHRHCPALPAATRYRWLPLPEQPAKGGIYPVLYDSWLPAPYPHPRGTQVLWSDGSVTRLFGVGYHGTFRDEAEFQEALEQEKREKMAKREKVAK